MKNTKSQRKVKFEPKMRLNKTETRNKVGYRLHVCTSAIMLYPRCMYPSHFLTIHARHLHDCLARFAGCHVFTFVLQIVAPVKSDSVYVVTNSKQALGTAATVNHFIDKVYQQVIKRRSFGLMTYSYFSVQFA